MIWVTEGVAVICYATGTTAMVSRTIAVTIALRAVLVAPEPVTVMEAAALTNNLLERQVGLK